MKKQPQITDRTRQKFIDAFCLLYAQMPIEKISIQKLTNEAGYNRSTFYHYFADIYVVLEFVENDLLSYFSKSLESQETKTPQQILQLFEEKEIYVKALLGRYGNLRFLERIKKEMHISEKYFENSSDKTLIPYLMEFHISTSLSLFHLWLNREKDLSSEKLFSLIHNLYTSGIEMFMDL